MDNRTYKQVGKTGIFCLDVKDIFAEYHYSEEYLSRTFRKITGKTLTEYVNQKKLSFAAVLIQNTDKSIETICYQCGFKYPFFV